MKQVFPSVRARRLGQRGMSKYCHSGLRKNYVLDVPSLPDLSDTSSNSGNSSCNKSLFGLDSTTDENQKAILCVVMEWAEKHFKMKFDTFKDLAIFLLENNCVDNRSVSAFTLLSLDHSTGTNTVGKHRETQFQLQKKLQEREQKRKLQEQQPGMSRPCLERSKARRRSGASRNSSGGSNSSGSSEIRSLSSGATVGGASKNTLIDNHEPKNLIRGTVKQDSDVPDICLKKENAKEGKSLTLDPVIAPPSFNHWIFHKTRG
ncbi:DNA-binding protein RFX7 [Armadillidium vulgare]|nr:DNA-binding protein RFX7 [Armadillidium vulgare]